MAKLTIIRFDLNSPDGYDVNRLPEGVKGNPQLMMWKELCRSGIYETGGVKHNIDREFLQNIVDTFWERNQKGIEVPCPVGHTHDPEAKRGRVIYVELREGRDGCVHLYGIIEFVDFNAKKTLCNSGVSIEAPEVVTDGDGETHKYGLEHVAFTDYPVVAGMDGFRDVVFSIFQKKENSMGKRKRFTDEAAFETCPNCGHTFDDDIVDEDIVQSRYSRFDDDIYDDDDIGVTQSRFDDLIYDDDLEDDVVQSRYSRRCSRFADDLDDDIRQSRRCSRFADEVIYDDDIIDDEEIDEIRQSRHCSRFDDDVPMSRYSRRCSRFDDIIEDEDGNIDDVVQSRYSRFSDDEMLGEDEDIIQSRYARRCSRFDDEPIDMDEDVIQSRFGRGRRCSLFDELVYGDEDEVLGDELEDIQQSRYGRRCSRFDDLVDLDEDIDIDEDEDIDVDEDVVQSRFGKRCAKRFDDDIRQSRKRCSRFDELVDETEDEEVIANELTDAVDNKFGKKFADEVMYDEMPVKNELQVETEKLSAGKKFSLGAAETVSANILKENRELQVQNLLSEGKINRIQAKQILDRFCNQQAISFSVNSGDNSEFKNIIALMKSGIGADYSEKTGVQFALPAESGGNELLQEIERRAAERKG